MAYRLLPTAYSLQLLAFWLDREIDDGDDDDGGSDDQGCDEYKFEDVVEQYECDDGYDDADDESFHRVCWVKLFVLKLGIFWWKMDDLRWMINSYTSITNEGLLINNCWSWKLEAWSWKGLFWGLKNGHEYTNDFLKVWSWKYRVWSVVFSPCFWGVFEVLLGFQSVIVDYSLLLVDNSLLFVDDSLLLTG